MASTGCPSCGSDDATNMIYSSLSQGWICQNLLGVTLFTLTYILCTFRSQFQSPSTILYFDRGLPFWFNTPEPSPSTNLALVSVNVQLTNRPNTARGPIGVHYQGRYNFQCIKPIHQRTELTETNNKAKFCVET